MTPIRIGAVLPFSGGLELFGNQAKIGIDLAVAEINAAIKALAAKGTFEELTKKYGLEGLLTLPTKS